MDDYFVHSVRCGCTSRWKLSAEQDLPHSRADQSAAAKGFSSFTARPSKKSSSQGGCALIGNLPPVQNAASSPAGNVRSSASSFVRAAAEAAAITTTKTAKDTKSQLHTRAFCFVPGPRDICPPSSVTVRNALENGGYHPFERKAQIDRLAAWFLFPHWRSAREATSERFALASRGVASTVLGWMGKCCRTVPTAVCRESPVAVLHVVSRNSAGARCLW